MKPYFHIFFFVFVVIKLEAQLPRVMLRNYNTDHGLASSEVHKVFQDYLGYQWIGTDNGISCFNGYEFKNYGPLDGIEDPVVVNFGEDRNKSLWACTLSGRLYKKEGNKFTPHPLNSSIVEMAGNMIQSFMIDSEDNFYIGIIGKGILVIKNNDIRWLSSNNDNLQIVKKGNNIVYATKDNLLTPTKISVLYFTDNKKYLYEENSKNIHLNNTSRACIYKNDTILICNGNALLVLYKDNIRSFPFQENINNIVVINSEIYVSYNNSNGVRKYKDIQNLLKNRGENIITDIRGGGVTEDRNKLLWFNTIDNGLFLMPNENIKIFDKNHFGENEYITSIAPIDSVSCYALLRNGSVFYLNLVNNNCNNIYSIPNALAYNSLLYNPFSKELLYFDNKCDLQLYKNKKWKTYPIKSCGYQVYNRIGSNNLFYIHYHGFNIINQSTKQLEFESFGKLPAIRTLCVLETKDSKIFVGNVNGLFEFKDEKLIKVDLKTGTSPIRIEALEELKDGTLVIGTKGRGLLLKKNEKISSITSANKLTSDMIECVHVDDDDNIWVGTLNGLNKLKFQNEKWDIFNYSTATGLPSNEINTIKSSKNIIWIGTPKGLAYIDIKKYFSMSKFSKPLIERIEINNEEINKNQQITLPYNRNNIQIQYITLAYQKFGNILYRYRFKENANWTTTFDKRITYIAQEGSYRFEIQSQNENNSWTESTYWDFTISPPWWKSWIFLTSAILIICLAAYSFYRLRIRQLKNIAKTEHEKIQLQNKALQAQMNPHFLFNCLNSIQNLLLHGESDKAVDYLSKFAKLVRNVLNTSNKEKITLESDLILLNNYLELEQIRFGEKLSYNISVNDDIDQYDIMVPPLLIQPFIENAIIHGIAPLSDKKGKIDIIYSMINNKLDIQVIDNGIGVHQSKKLKNIGEKRESYGMETSKQRIRLLEKNQDIYFLVEELKDSNASIIGTKINIQIPI